MRANVYNCRALTAMDNYVMDVVKTYCYLVVVKYHKKY